MSPSGTRVTSTATRHSPLMRRDMMRRRILPAFIIWAIRALSFFVRHAPDQQAGSHVDDEGHDEKHETDFYEGADMQVGCGFCKFVRDDRSHRVLRREHRP